MTTTRRVERVMHAAMYRDGIPGTVCRPGWEPMVTPVTDDVTCRECRQKLDGGAARSELPVEDLSGQLFPRRPAPTTTHTLKVAAPYFDALLDRSKTFEVRYSGDPRFGGIGEVSE